MSFQNLSDYNSVAFSFTGTIQSFLQPSDNIFLEKLGSKELNFVPRYFVHTQVHELPIPVAERSKTWVCGHSMAGIGSSNPTGSMDVCVL